MVRRAHSLRTCSCAQHEITGRTRLILLTGATGYVGGRLLSALQADGRRIRCLARRPEYLEPKVGPTVEIARGDVLDPTAVANAMEGVDVAYYLVHSMGTASDFEEEDRNAAAIFGSAARAAGVSRIVYLGGLGRGDDLSRHLRSRQEVGRILASFDVNTIEFRASIVIGSGSLSFEMVRSLVTRLPIMLTPRWTRSLAQPIAIEDLIEYLRAAVDLKIVNSIVYEIGGADCVTYHDLMREFARQRRVRRLIIPVPVLTPYLSSLWLGLVTPLLAPVGRKLIDSVKNDTVATDDRALRDFAIRPRGVQEAIERALQNEDRALAATRWSDALSSLGPVPSFGGVRFGNRIVDSRAVAVQCTAARAFAPIRRIGGATGWYYGNWLWRVRGFVDRLSGGVGLRRGRRDPDHVVPGEALDFWRVQAVEPDRRLLLFAEMRIPGRAWLQFEVQPTGDSATIRQTAVYDPAGLFGLIYWYGLYPVHVLIFRGMLRRIAKAAEEGSVGPNRQ
ncbi:MAG: SDR family oxidoreductase [Gemmatimonadota bacterium]|nr:MAG: SDR family oxidoreductase [Gemmatimonadota bacterium]